MRASSSHRSRVTIAGSGAFGLVSALALARAGWRVTVCDPHDPPANASAVAAGMLAPAFETALDEAAAGGFDLLFAARDLWPGLAQDADVALDRSGAVAVGREAWLAAVAARFQGLGLHPIGLDRRTLDDLWPGLAPDLVSGVMTREDWRLEPLQAMGALRRAAEAQGVVFRREQVRDRGEADLLVVATGYAQELAPELAVLSPIKGHILRASGEAAGRVTLRGEGAYVVASGAGVAMGATMEAGVSDPGIDPARVEALAKAGGRLSPRLARADWQAATGIRAATPDALPLVGASSEPGVVLAVGARRNGWLLAALAGRMVAAIAEGADPGPYAARLAPGRFGG